MSDLVQGPVFPPPAINHQHHYFVAPDMESGGPKLRRSGVMQCSKMGLNTVLMQENVETQLPTPFQPSPSTQLKLYPLEIEHVNFLFR